MYVICTSLQYIIDYRDLGIVASKTPQDLDYPDKFEWNQEVRIIEVALYIYVHMSGID